MFNSLYSRLSLTLIALFAMVGLLFLYLTQDISTMYHQEVSQKLNATLADHIVHEELLIENHEINKQALEHVFHMLMIINPNIELYLLDKDGYIIGYDAPKEKIKREQVALKPINTFLSQDTTYPLLGDDPRDQNRQKVFSAARIPAKGPLEGYLYIILASEKYENVLELIGKSQILKYSFTTLMSGTIITLLSGFVVFFLLTNRLRKLTQLFDKGGNDNNDAPIFARYPIRGKPKDEIDVLGLHYNRMADRINCQFRELSKADQLRRELIANVSHDLRTPLATMQGYLETLLLKQHTLPAETTDEYLRIATSSSQQLSNLVEELFELARLDSVETVVFSEPFSIAELIQDIAQKFKLRAEEMKIRLETRFNKNTPMVVGDIAMLQRALENLIENALKHTPENGCIRLAFVPQSENVTIKISDTGCGIPENEIEHIFERFYRLDKSRRSGSNAGLGLAITKRILDLHGSKIDVTSAVNKGTTFSFNMPIYSA